MDPLALLSRTDKWFLGGGKGALYAPPFPRFLTAPGFWDECYFADLRLERLFTVLFLKSSGRPIRFHSRLESWRPDRMVILHESEQCILREIRCVIESQIWVSRFERVSGLGPLDVVVWSLQEERPAGFGTPWQSFRFQGSSPFLTGVFETAWPAEIEPDRTAVESEQLAAGSAMLPPLGIELAWGTNRPLESWASRSAQRHDPSPLYETSMLPELFVRGRLASGHVEGPGEGLRHLCAHVRWADSEPLQVAVAAGLESEVVRNSLSSALESDTPLVSEHAWRKYFEGVPWLESSDPHLEAAYWYRWYGLRLNTVDVPGLPLRTEGGLKTGSPYVTEGIGFFRNFITYSAQAHLREVAWMHEPALAQGILENLVAVQRADGSFPGHNYSARPPRDFYHADFATGLRLVETLHPEVDTTAFRKALGRYARYLAEDRQFHSNGPSPMVWVKDQNETGQEYMSRYQAANENADDWGEIRLGGVDGTTYLILLMEELGLDASPWRDALDRTRTDGFFADVLEDGRLSEARPAAGLYPYLLSNPAKGIERWLADPEEFWLERGIPATAKSDPTFSAEAEWKDRRTNCPWNGRSWPMVNSHLVDAVANVARQSDPSVRPIAGEALMRAIRLLFHEGDPTRPSCYEHFNPITGVPALYRGYDDYMHSWIVDLILRHAVGVQVSPSGEATFDPLSCGVEWIRCENVQVSGSIQSVNVSNGAARRS